MKKTNPLEKDIINNLCHLQNNQNENNENIAIKASKLIEDNLKINKKIDINKDVNKKITLFFFCFNFFLSFKKYWNWIVF